MSTSIFNWTTSMGPVLKWEGEWDDSPVCNGACAQGWTRDPNTDLWVCARCRRPSHAYLRECETCEQIYLPYADALTKVNANRVFAYVLDHEGECG